MATYKITGGGKLKEYLKKAQAKIGSAHEVHVGFLEGSTEPGGANSAMVAAIQEFGSRRIPPRPFFRNMIKQNEMQWGTMLGRLLRAADYDAKTALGQMGEEMIGELQESIVAISEPPLSPVTLLLRKRFGNSPESITGSDVFQAMRDVAAGVQPNVSGTQAKPLVWTGTMLKNVDKEVV
jgi:hypothetical protein